MSKETVRELLALAISMSDNQQEIEKIINNLEPYGRLFMSVFCSAKTQLAIHQAGLLNQLLAEDSKLTREEALLLVLDSDTALKKVTQSVVKSLS